MPDFLTVCQQAARAGGAVLLDWAERFSVREKGPADLVTEADLASQEVIRRTVLDAFPDHEFLSEEDALPPTPSPLTGEGRGEGGSEFNRTVPSITGSTHYRWIVDPLDGTTNYVHRIPDFAVSVALERAGQVLVATVFNPVSGECFTAQLGGGAFLNGRRLHTSAATELSQALVTVSFSPRIDRESQSLEDFIRIITTCQSVRRTGSAALNLSYLAAGRFDGDCARDTKAWDVAAGWLLVTEAGGCVTAFDGSPARLDRPQFIAAGTGALHQQMLKLLA